MVSRSRLATSESLTVSVTVTNSGTRPGDEVVQLYVRDDAGSVTRPVKELKGFTRVSLAPGAQKTITFALTPSALAFYDVRYRKVVEPGTYTVMVGGSSERTQQARFEMTGAVHVVDARRIR